MLIDISLFSYFGFVSRFCFAQKNETSVKVRFRTTLTAGKYYVNVVEKVSYSSASAHNIL